ncbi:hypothetical protein FHR24_002957 [Wenyingzhuangia heitensis]|uniref:DUF4955 domain-containing protein n=1 Tax=Wenyingzhuangia heitensis TaxID=1487859 RepID=A0ABX0UCA5_9FLAO|nr:DUF4955 domain-containing protein [Wenyingzhuangia heitensis]NIJ46469.1 hypothetical protein [Wenyingzhuangia heitensis]
MNKRHFILKTLAFCTLSLAAQKKESSVWNNYVTAQENNTEAVLPNFSYAGYKYSQEAIPDVNHKIFNVLDFGAIPNDAKSDKEAVKKAIAAAQKNKKGIVFFPKGKYYINTASDDISTISINSSNIVLRGEGDGENGTVLFFEKNLPPKDPKKIYSSPSALEAKSKKGDKLLTTVVSNSSRETHKVTVKDASNIKTGDWVILKVVNNSKDLIAYDTKPLEVQPEWTKIVNKGVQVNERHQVAKVDGNVITFVEPIHYDVKAKHNWEIHKYGHLKNIGFENIRFEGNWTKDFVHHRSAEDDGGWTILSLSRTVNSWIRNCTFKNVSRAAGFSQSAYCTAINIKVTGTIGHNSVHAGGGSTGILLAKITDTAGMHHAVGVGGGSTTGTVIWRCKYPAHTSFESHASQPRCTLFDNVEGGFFAGRAGGARQSLPNHGRYLVLWNYKETDEAEKDFRFVATDTWFWRIVPPIIVGFHGAGTTFKTDEVQIAESIGTPVQPESLFEEQLKLRLGKLPNWMHAYK